MLLLAAEPSFRVYIQDLFCFFSQSKTSVGDLCFNIASFNSIPLSCFLFLQCISLMQSLFGVCLLISTCWKVVLGKKQQLGM